MSHSSSGTISEADRWSYEQAFSHCLGLTNRAEQQRLRHCRVAIPGMGGVGGMHLMSLARMGIGKFRIADADHFEAGNVNRQFGATIGKFVRPKAEVLAESAKGFDPEAEPEFITELATSANVDYLLEGVDLIFDAGPCEAP